MDNERSVISLPAFRHLAEPLVFSSDHGLLISVEGSPGHHLGMISAYDVSLRAWIFLSKQVKILLRELNEI